MNVREKYEQLEKTILSPYAKYSADSRGRLVFEDPCAVRTDFQRDRDRVIYSKAFRRLKHKTQVFIAPSGDHYRTRLTHTLEVAQIARTVARALRLNEDLTEAIALGHDLGHAPFGHAGEQALDEIIRHYLPNRGFRHNEQSLRVVDHLEKLNLTWEVRDGILKHSKGRSSIELSTAPDDCPATLEGQLVRMADRMAYLNHDADDAIRAKIIKEEDIPEFCRRVLGSRHSVRINTMVTDCIESSMDKEIVNLSSNVKKAVEEFKEFLFNRVYIGSVVRDDRKVKAMLWQVFRYYMDHTDELPLEFRTDIDLEHHEDLVQGVCDYVSGMTDLFILKVYRELFAVAPWNF